LLFHACFFDQVNYARLSQKLAPASDAVTSAVQWDFWGEVITMTRHAKIQRKEGTYVEFSSYTSTRVSDSWV